MLWGVWFAAVGILLHCCARWGMVALTGAKPSRELIVSTCVSAGVCLVLVWTAHLWMFGAIDTDSWRG